MSYTLGGLAFETRKTLAQYAHDVLHRWPLGTPMTGSDAEFVQALFWSHPDAHAKAGQGVNHFVVRPHPYGDARNFWVVCVDGVIDNFSIKTCIKELHLTTTTDDRKLS